MSYIEGFVVPVPRANKDKFIAHATFGDPAFLEHGATRVVESWQADVPKGTATDFYRAVAATDDEDVVFSFIEWRDKAARDAFGKVMWDLMKTDDRMNPEKNIPPFDGKRMIFGSFQPIVDQGSPAGSGYVQGFLVPVPEAKKEAYRQMAEEAWPWFRKHGALRVVEGWPDDIKHGKVTDFYRAVDAHDDEVPLFSFIEWESQEACQAAQEAMMSDPEMKMPEKMPFDGKRMVFGGFTPVVRMGE